MDAALMETRNHQPAVVAHTATGQVTAAGLGLDPNQGSGASELQDASASDLRFWPDRNGALIGRVVHRGDGEVLVRLHLQDGRLEERRYGAEELFQRSGVQLLVGEEVLVWEAAGLVLPETLLPDVDEVQFPARPELAARLLQEPTVLSYEESVRRLVRQHGATETEAQAAVDTIVAAREAGEVLPV
jgi:hypothetical protein